MAVIKLAFVTQFPIDTECPLGGVEAVSINLVRALSVYSQLDIHVVTLYCDTCKATQETWNNVTIHRLPQPQGSELINALTKS